MSFLASSKRDVTFLINSSVSPPSSLTYSDDIGCCIPMFDEFFQLFSLSYAGIEVGQELLYYCYVVCICGAVGALGRQFFSRNSTLLLRRICSLVIFVSLSSTLLQKVSNLPAKALTESFRDIIKCINSRLGSTCYCRITGYYFRIGQYNYS